MPSVTQAPSPTVSVVESVECELTEVCNLRCGHCCTLSGPTMSHGSMTLADWQRVVDDIGTLGIPTVQFIGGEPTRSPHLPNLIEYALDRRLAVEVYSNLTHIRPGLWKLFTRKGVHLATSYYSDDPAEHDKITESPGSHARTRANIVKTLELGIPLRAGLVEILDGQRVQQAEAELRALGVKHTRIDHVRKVGRAATTDTPAPAMSELCGRCFHQRAAISPDGYVYGCILSRHLVAGNVKSGGLAKVLTGPEWAEITESVPARRNACTPDDSGDCDPANTEACLPSFPGDDDGDGS
ncbi:radical SAM/SPASM domain-containing protein [Streptomyces klenkii]|uniref:Radical SAM/SPASM domain-containing protein n=1 Tax=Streptomyces klenkii TaxID=1420899 RepID=A0A3B0BEL6_9ACTN|nr:radical SAM/SPASM domain-containing protein [Streptomyces klenkii]RKN70784.1 radical SAM/SPASM domain-containing protein [Streptomyces klenkii]